MLLAPRRVLLGEEGKQEEEQLLCAWFVPFEPDALPPLDLFNDDIHPDKIPILMKICDLTPEGDPQAALGKVVAIAIKNACKVCATQRQHACDRSQLLRMRLIGRGHHLCFMAWPPTSDPLRLQRRTMEWYAAWKVRWS